MVCVCKNHMQIRRMDKHHRELAGGKTTIAILIKGVPRLARRTTHVCNKQKHRRRQRQRVQYVHVQQPMNVTASKHQTLYRQALIFQLIIMHAGAEKGAAAKKTSN